LNYDLDGSVESDPHILEVLDAPAEASFDKMIQTLLRDLESGALPTGSEPNFSELWKSYMKTLGTELNLKGNALMKHPFAHLIHPFSHTCDRH
jgi:hypothetical protein